MIHNKAEHVKDKFDKLIRK